MGLLGCGALLAWATALSFFDIRERRLPNALTLSGAAVLLAVAVGTGHGATALAGALGLSGLYLVVHLAAPAALGAGDVKLALGCGALTGALGTEVWVLAAVGAPLLTAVGGVLAALRGRSAVPHGPSMCAATLGAALLALL